ncbi:unnamed protein product [Closterium sp. NIES-64]|nr:unnamed protein product [Closterium sp. NIES-64]
MAVTSIMGTQRVGLITVDANSVALDSTIPLPPPPSLFASYVAQEYVQTGLITGAIDVYAFGVILLELITGHVLFHPGRQPPTSLPGVDTSKKSPAIPIANNEEFTRLIDYRLEGRFDPAQLQAVSMLVVLCLASNPKHRPTMD